MHTFNSKYSLLSALALVVLSSLTGCGRDVPVSAPTIKLAPGGYKPGPKPAEYYAYQTRNPVVSKLSFEEIAKRVTALQNSSGLNRGSSPEILAYVFFDPQCPYCAKLAINLAGADAIKISNNVAWVPIGFLHEYSTLQGAALLSSPEPWLTFMQHETYVSAGKGQEFALNVKVANQKSIDQVVSNTQVWKETGATQVPFTVTRSPSGKTLALYGTLAGFQMSEFLSRP